MKGSMCKVCGHEHWLREPHVDLPNTSREGRCVLKAEAARPDATRTAATAKARPASMPRKSGGDGTAAKPKTALKAKQPRRRK